MDTTPEKDELLRSAGFRYHFDVMAYVNAKAKKVVSVEFVEDYPDRLEDVIEQANDSGDWWFHFVEPISPAEKRAFLARLALN
jgi:hypothetical protein